LKGTALSLIGVAALEVLSAGRAEAQVYLRRNADGVLEATDSPESSEFRLRFSAKGVLIHSRGFRSRARPEFDPYIEDAAAKFGVNSDFVRAIISVESAYDEFAVSSKGAQGIMQLMPGTARRFGVSNPFDPAQAIMGGTEYLSYLLGLFRGNLDLAAAGYNAGENAVLRYGGVPPYKETRNYVARVNTAFNSGPVVMSASAETRTPGAGPSTTLGFSGSLPPSLQPTNGPKKAAEKPRPARPLVRVPPRLYYRWVDGAGSTHFADSPPTDGSAYRTIRGLP
jgi:hypothetical protein